MEDALNKTAKKLFLASLLFSGISVRLFGDVYLTEVFLSLIAINSILKGERVFQGEKLRIIPRLFVIWFVANLLSSFYAQKTLQLILIAIFTVVISGLSLRSVLQYFQDGGTQVDKILYFFAFGRIIGLVFQPQPYTNQLPWKFGFGEWTILIALLSLKAIKSTGLPYLLISTLIVISLMNQARSLAFILIGSLLLATISKRKSMGIGALLGVIIFATMAYYAYLNVALTGHLGNGELTRARALTSSQIGPLSARKEFLFSSKAFIASPLIGYGFSPEVKSRIIDEGVAQMLKYGIPVDSSYLTELPMHSFLMSSLVEGGIFAGLFWIFTLVIALKMIRNIGKFPGNHKYLYAYIPLTLIDRTLFSPYGAYERLNMAFLCGYMLYLYSKNWRVE